MRNSFYFALVCTLALGAAGCANKHIVRAAPPSVSTPPPDITERMPAPVPPTSEQPAEVPPPAEPAASVPPMVPTKRPAQPPRPPTAPPDVPAPKPAAPQIAPAISPMDLEARKKNTTDNLSKAEGNFHKSDGKQLNPAQQDLRDKISGFIAQAHDAIQKEDWVRAQNVAYKALVLSEELLKSF
jgi:hypothetical protein